MAKELSLGATLAARRSKATRPSVNGLVTAILARLSPEVCADVETIFYVIGRDRDHGEYYEDYVEDVVRKYEADENRRWEYVYHVVSKTSMFDGLVSGLRRGPTATRGAVV